MRLLATFPHLPASGAGSPSCTRISLSLSAAASSMVARSTASRRASVPSSASCARAAASDIRRSSRDRTSSSVGPVARGASESSALSASATFLSLMRWDENYHLFILGASSFACAWFGRSALRQRWRYWVRLHIAGMGLSYLLMLIAFYVDNGKQLPLWKDLPHFTYWLIPIAVGMPLIAASTAMRP